MVAPVSVIIPCFKASNTIVRAIDSVINQTVQPSEIIVIDDASGDRTTSILYKLQQKYRDLITVIVRDKNLGVSSARNLGWERASQPFLAFLDADDAWHSRKIEIQYAYMKSHPEVVLTAHNYKILGVDEYMPSWGIEGLPRIQKISKVNFLMSNQFITPSVMLRRDICKRFIEGRRYMEDHMLWLEIIFSGAKVIKIDFPLAATYKKSFGESGLSSHLLKMQAGDLSNYKNLLEKNHINSFQWVLLYAYSWSKFARRLVISIAYAISRTVFKSNDAKSVRFK